MAEPYDIMAKYGNAPSRQQLYYKRPYYGGASTHAKSSKPSNLAYYEALLPSLKENPGTPQRIPAKGNKIVNVNRSGKGDKKYVMGE